MDIILRKATKLILLFAIVAFLLLLPVMLSKAANDINAASQSNGTSIELTPVWAEYASISNFATGTGNTTITISVNAVVNYSQATIYGRIKRDGMVLETFNVTKSYTPETVTYVAPVAETLGTHNYTFEAYSTSGRKGIFYNRTFSVQYLNTGSFCTDCPNATVAANLANWNATNNASIQINITQVTSLRAEQDAQNTSIDTKITNASAQISRTQVTGQEGVDTGQNTTHTNLANYLNNTFPGSSFITTLGTIATGIWQGTKIAGAYLVDADRWNGTLNSHNTSISSLQSNDSVHDSVNLGQNTSFQNSSFGILLTNGSNAIATGYYDAIVEIPASGTITSLSVQGRYAGAINLSLMYNATATPIYPGDIVGWANVTSGSSNSSSGLSISVAQNGNLMAYVGANAGAVNKTNLRGILKRS